MELWRTIEDIALLVLLTELRVEKKKKKKITIAGQVKKNEMFSYFTRVSDQQRNQRMGKRAQR